MFSEKPAYYAFHSLSESSYYGRYRYLAVLPSRDGALTDLPYHGESPILPSRDGALGVVSGKLCYSLSCNHLSYS